MIGIFNIHNRDCLESSKRRFRKIWRDICSNQVLNQHNSWGQIVFVYGLQFQSIRSIFNTKPVLLHDYLYLHWTVGPYTDFGVGCLCTIAKISVFPSYLTVHSVDWDGLLEFLSSLPLNYHPFHSVICQEVTDVTPFISNCIQKSSNPTREPWFLRDAKDSRHKRIREH